MKLSVERQEQLIDSVAGRVSNWGLGAPAIALLEAHKPLSFLASQALLVFVPLLTLCLGRSSLAEYASLLEDESSVERVIRRLEETQDGGNVAR